MDNKLRLAHYRQRSAYVYAENPEAWAERERRGRIIQRVALMDKTKRQAGKVRLLRPNTTTPAVAGKGN